MYRNLLELEKTRMKRVLALTNEDRIFAEVKNNINEFENIEIVTFPDSLNLIDNFVNNHTELIILDLDLLNGEVIKLMKILRAIKKNSQIILILTENKIKECSKAISMGVVSYILKPVSEIELTNLVISTLKNHKHHI
jgi:response regulator of citrate/malate metabolism